MMLTLDKMMRDERLGQIRETRLRSVRDLGYEIIDVRQGLGLTVGQRYHLRAPSGELLDNGGRGYCSVTQLQRAAEAHATLRLGGASEVLSQLERSLSSPSRR